jgi:hypothetical protein
MGRLVQRRNGRPHHPHRWQDVSLANFTHEVAGQSQQLKWRLTGRLLLATRDARTQVGS